MRIDPRLPVGQIVREDLTRARVFERVGIDYCCNGRTPLVEACAVKGLELAAILDELAGCRAECGAAEDRWDGDDLPLSCLADHIEATHHAYLRRELPRLDGLAEKVRAAHGARHPEVVEMARVFGALREELEGHLLKEERILFPYVKQLEAAESMPAFHCGSIENPLRVMEQEHDDAGLALSRLRELTGDYTPPADACTTYRALLHGLEELEADLHRHIHKENNILFPRAREAERALSGCAG